MAKKSAGILLYRMINQALQVLLVHPGGPFWSKKDIGAWSIPKGEFTDEDPLEAAIREFHEELGIKVVGDFIELTPIKQNSGKIVYAFALQQDFNTSQFKSNTFSIEWPPKSGKYQDFPEIDKAEWFDIPTSKEKINQFQFAIIDELIGKLEIKRTL